MLDSNNFISLSVISFIDISEASLSQKFTFIDWESFGNGFESFHLNKS